VPTKYYTNDNLPSHIHNFMEIILQFKHQIMK